ncbi:MAG: anthranilate phosphoribosyltransferase [Candidatus Latescibacterota bacterium]|jgi:anthranilate phosphoribosyltransferase
MISTYIESVKDGQSLGVDEAEQCLNIILEQEISDENIAELLVVLSQKGEEADEILGFCRALLGKALEVSLPSEVLDLCGTGGSGLDRFNVSTTAAFVLAAGGVPVVKHGNRGSKKPNGSFDLLEKLGCNFDLRDGRMREVFDETGLSFLFARKFHPVMGKVVAARQMANRRTIFNLSAPLCNPVNPQYQMVGTIDVDMGRRLAQVLRELGRKRFLVVVGAPGIDEMSISGETQVIEYDQGDFREYTLSPSGFGISALDYDTIPGGDYTENQGIFLSLMEDQTPGSILDMVCLNAGAAFYCFGKTETIQDGYLLSKDLFKNGLVREKFLEFKRVSNL